MTAPLRVPPPAPLPVDALLPELIAAVAAHGAAVLRAETGAGKTTRVPPALLDALADGRLSGTGAQRGVLVVQPRRLAARAAARRIAEERGGRVGEEVGWHVRFDRRAGRATRLLVVTEGLAVRRVADDPSLPGIGAVVLDEFHERNLDGDLLFALLRRVRAELRPELKLLVMSAADLGPALPAALDGAPVLAAPGRSHPIEVLWQRTDREEPLHAAVARGVAALLPRTPGDLLVFLPGRGEIRRAREALADFAQGHDLALVELHGDLPPERQDEALRAGPRRRVILATNVAETSVTVAGVTAVIDSGWQRQMRFDAGSGLNRLELVRIAATSAQQRAGRAGRTGPGICLRLWSEHEQRALPERDQPELLRVDLAATQLLALAWGERDAADLPWLDAPPPAALVEARALLSRLGATAPAGLTARGRAMAALPLPPRLAALLLAGAQTGVAREAATAAALLAERDPFLADTRGDGRRGATHVSDSDLADRVALLQAHERPGGGRQPGPGLHAGAARNLLAVRDDLLATLREAGVPTPPGPSQPAARRAALRQAVFAAFPDRLARRRQPDSPRARLIGGGGVVLEPESAVTAAELFVALSLGSRSGGDARVRLASAVEREWLAAEQLVVGVETVFDERALRVAAVRRLRFEDLVLEESPAELPEAAAVAECLARAAATRLEQALPLDAPETRAWLARLRWLAARRPELQLPAFTEAELLPLLESLVAGCRSFAETRKLSLAALLAAHLPPARRAELERLAPERIAVPSGSRLALDYDPARAPRLAVRIQELFGLAATPRVDDGRVAVTLDLLGPNGRSQQITDDLSGFWARNYPALRRELMRRYPRHAWPEDPLAASPERRPRPRAR